MTGRRVPRADLPQSIPTLFGDATVVAVLAPHVTTDLGALWDIARAAARARPVMVVDLCFEHPRIGAPGREGIADAFLFGVPLESVVHEAGPDVYAIGAGTPPDEPKDVWAHHRWTRLARGFRHEGALLIVVTPVEALGPLPVPPDRVVVLTTEDIATAVDAGVELERVIAVDRDRLPMVETRPRRPPRPAPRRVRPSLMRRMSRPAVRLGRVLRERERRGGPVVIAATATLAVGLAAAAVLFWPAAGEPASSAASALSATPVDGDSLFYSVQVAAYQSATQAEDHARAYAAGGFTPIVTPVRLGRQGVWYRLLVGTLPTPAAAQRELTAAWRRGLLERPNGTILRTPHTLRLNRYRDVARASAAAGALREDGLAGYIVAAPRGAQLLFGAFESPEQATLADSILTALGRPGTLVNRVGIAQ